MSSDALRDGRLRYGQKNGMNHRFLANLKTTNEQIMLELPRLCELMKQYMKSLGKSIEMH